MQNQHGPVRLLALAVSFAMCSPLAVMAQTGTQSSPPMAQSASKAAPATAKLTSADRKAIQDMAMASRAEIEMAHLADTRGHSDEVKTFARQMADEYGRSLSEVQSLAHAKGLTLEDKLDAKHRAKIASLDKLSGEAFDRAYLKHAGVDAQKETHARLQKNAKDVKDADLKAQVAKMTPVVEQHLRRAEQLTSGHASSMGKSGTQGQTGSSKDKEPKH